MSDFKQITLDDTRKKIAGCLKATTEGCDGRKVCSLAGEEMRWGKASK